MSSHHSRRFYDLHHQQVDGARERRRQRQVERREQFITWRNGIWADISRFNLALSVYGFIWFIFVATQTVTYAWLAYCYP